jgi:uncharacterized membrane protein YraQ (UPF0718 family)
MLVKLKINMTMGVIAFLFTYLFSFLNNTWQTSLFRAIGGFIIFFLLGFVLSFILKQLAGNTNVSLEEEPKLVVENNSEIEKDHPKVEELTEEPGFQAVPLHSLHHQGNGK